MNLLYGEMFLIASDLKWELLIWCALNINITFSFWPKLYNSKNHCLVSSAVSLFDLKIDSQKGLQSFNHKCIKDWKEISSILISDWNNLFSFTFSSPVILLFSSFDNITNRHPYAFPQLVRWTLLSNDNCPWIQVHLRIRLHMVCLLLFWLVWLFCYFFISFFEPKHSPLQYIWNYSYSREDHYFSSVACWVFWIVSSE